MPRYGMSNGCRCTRTFLGAPPTPRFGVSEAKVANPGRKNAPRERGGLFDIVRWELPKTVRRRAADSVCPEPPHPKERACASAAANQVARVRVSKDGAAIIPPHASRRIAAQRGLSQQPSSRAAMLLSMRARARGAFWQAKRRRGREDQPAAVGNDHRLGFPVFGLFFTGSGATSTCRAVGAPVRRYPASRASPWQRALSARAAP